MAHWRRAVEDLQVAEHDLQMSPRSAASRAYYASFHAMSALFAAEGQVFKKHTALEQAVHRDLIRTGKMENSIGADYSNLFRLRMTCDYDVREDIGLHDAEEALQAATRILADVRQLHPEFA